MAQVVGTGSGRRLVADACSALKLLGLGSLLFRKGALPLGDLVIHKRFFDETGKWGPSDPRRKTYETELNLATSLGHEPGLDANDVKGQKHRATIISTKNTQGYPVSAADIDQLVSCVRHGLGLVTNDHGLYQLSGSFLITVLTAEGVLVEAYKAKILSMAEVQKALRQWKTNREKCATPDDERDLAAIGIAMRGGYIV